MSIRRPLAGMLLGGALLGGAGLAVIGGLTLQVPGLISVGLGATLAGCIAAGVAREAPAHVRGSAVEAAVWVAGWSLAAALVVAGVSTAKPLGGEAKIASACGVSGRSEVRRTKSTTATSPSRADRASESRSGNSTIGSPIWGAR